MAYTPAEIADAVWTYSARSVDGQAVPASDGTYLDGVGYAVWTYPTRTLDGGGGGITGSASVLQTVGSVDGTGTFLLKISGSGGVNQPVGSVNGIGVLRIKGLGDALQQIGAVSASGTIRFLASGGVNQEVGSVDASGTFKVGISGTANLGQEIAQVDGTGTFTVKYTGTGDAVQTIASISASGTVSSLLPRTGTAAVRQEIGSADGSGFAKGIYGFTVRGDFIVDGGSVVAGNEIRNPNAMMTSLGGFAVRLKNSTSSNIPHGTSLSASPDHDGSVIPQTSEFDCCGFAYGDITAGQYGWVVTTGVAEALLKDGTSATRGYWAKAADTDGRIVVTTAPGGIGSLSTSEHFREVGHCVESKGSGTDVLVKIVLHFL